MKNNPWMQKKSSFAMVAIDPLRAKITKWSNTLKQFVGNLPTNCLSVFDHFVGLVLKGLRCSFATLLKLSNKRKKKQQSYVLYFGAQTIAIASGISC